MVSVGNARSLNSMSQIECNMGTWLYNDTFTQHVILEDKETRLARLASRTFYSFDDHKEGTACAKPFYNLFYKSLEHRTGMNLLDDKWKLISLEGPAFGEKNEEG